MAVRAAIATIGLPSTVGAICAHAGLRQPHEYADRAFGMLIAMAIRGTVEFDLGLPLDRNAPVFHPGATVSP